MGIRRLISDESTIGEEATGEQPSREAQEEDARGTVQVSSAPRYRRFYDAAMKAISREMAVEPYPIPEGLASNSAVVGKGRNEQVRISPNMPESLPHRVDVSLV